MIAIIINQMLFRLLFDVLDEMAAVFICEKSLKYSDISI